ncbi:hypothetical protein, partial [Methylobacterium sp. J-070]|uniref:hypothetical protein n=1 Tax=Methylobacterium sp. J-070 TaxID=2836650 RepID=UPI001FB894CB
LSHNASALFAEADAALFSAKSAGSILLRPAEPSKTALCLVSLSTHARGEVTPFSFSGEHLTSVLSRYSVSAADASLRTTANYDLGD